MSRGHARALAVRPHCRRHPRHGARLATTAAAAVLLLAHLAGAAASVVEGPAADGLEIVLEGRDDDGSSHLLMLDWTGDAGAVAPPGCACQLLPPTLVGDGSNNDAALAATVRPGDARVFRLLLRPSARLACSSQCGRVSVGEVGSNNNDSSGWVLMPDEGAGVRLGSSSSGGGGASRLVGSFAWSGGDDDVLHALYLRAVAAPPMSTAEKPTPPLVPRAAALALFAGLNTAAAALSSPRARTP